MESQLQNSSQEEIMMNSGNGKMSTSSYLCRQSSTRWTPTTEQIKLLKELYYVNGVRSPTADQIQSICARLRRYGKIEGKNVFYWFQNHKARERQKKRLTPTVTTTTPEFHNNIIRNNGVVNWKQEEVTLNNGYSCNTNNPGISCASSSAGMVAGGGQSMGSFGYGPVTMENKFRDCSISGGGSLINGSGDVNQWTNAGGANYNTYVPSTCYSNFLNKISAIDEDKDQYSTVGPEIETLPLFPMHNEELNGHQNHGSHLSSNGFYTIKSPSEGYYTGGYHWSNGSGGNGASLELSLNSYGYSCYSNY